MVPAHLLLVISPDDPEAAGHVIRQMIVVNRYGMDGWMLSMLLPKLHEWKMHTAQLSS